MRNLQPIERRVLNPLTNSYNSFIPLDIAPARQRAAVGPEGGEMDFEQRLSREMLKIASWPRGPLQDADALLAHLLAHAAGILEAPRVLLAWEEVDEPWLHLAHRSGGGIERSREAPLADPQAMRRSCAAASRWIGRTPGRCAGRRSRGASSPSTARPRGGPSDSRRDRGPARRRRARPVLPHPPAADRRGDRRAGAARLRPPRRHAAVAHRHGPAAPGPGEVMEKDPPARRATASSCRDPAAHRRRPAGPPLLHRGAEAGAAGARRPGRSQRPAGGAGGPAEAPLGPRRSTSTSKGSTGSSPRPSPASSTGWCARPCSTSPATPGRPPSGSRSSGREPGPEHHRDRRRPRLPLHAAATSTRSCSGQKLGPVSLKERIAALGGSLAIDSGPGLTRLEMRLPDSKEGRR